MAKGQHTGCQRLFERHIWWRKWQRTNPAILRKWKQIRAEQKHAGKIIVKNCEKTVDNGLNM